MNTTTTQQRVMAGNARQRIQTNVMHWAHIIYQAGGTDRSPAT